MTRQYSNSDTYSNHKARLRGGEPYVGNHMFMGSGMSRSCNRCHIRSTGNFKLLKPWGMCCNNCNTEVIEARARKAAGKETATA